MTKETISHELLDNKHTIHIPPPNPGRLLKVLHTNVTTGEIGELIGHCASGVAIEHPLEVKIHRCQTQIQEVTHILNGQCYPFSQLCSSSNQHRTTSSAPCDRLQVNSDLTSNDIITSPGSKDNSTINPVQRKIKWIFDTLTSWINQDEAVW